MSTEDTTGKAKLFAKVAKVMAAVRTIPKDGVNTYDKYHYIKGDDVFERVGQAMSAANLAILPSVIELNTTEGKTANGGIMLRTVVRGQITLADGDTGETWTSEWYGEGSDRGDKSINKAMTAMMKYYLLRVFNVGSGEDADEESPEAPIKAQQKNPPQQTQQRPQQPPQAPQKPVTPSSNGHTPSPTVDVDKLIAGWTAPADAKNWAVDAKLATNEFSANNSFKKIVKDDFGGTCTTANVKDIFRAFATHYLNKPVEQVKETV